MNPPDPNMNTQQRERQRLSRVFAERLPAVQEATLRLHEIMGLPIGERLDERMPPMPWMLPPRDQVRNSPVDATRRASQAPGGSMGPPPRPVLPTGPRIDVSNDRRGFTRSDLERMLHQRRLARGQAPVLTAERVNPSPHNQPGPALPAKEPKHSMQPTGSGLDKLGGGFHPNLRHVERAPPATHMPATSDSHKLKRKKNYFSPDVRPEAKIPKVVIDLTSPEAAPKHAGSGKP